MPSAADRKVFWSAAAVVVVLDAVTKYLAAAHLDDGGAVRLIGDWVRLRLVFNPGAAFGLDVGPWSRWVFAAIAVGAVILLERMSAAAAPGDRLRQFAVGLVAGGAAGNLIDRLLSSQGVVDFLDVGVGAVRWPTFNVADVAVSCGALVLALSLWREDARRAALDAGGTP